MMNSRELTYKALNEILIHNQNCNSILHNYTNKYNLDSQEKQLFYALTKGTITRKIYLDYLIGLLNSNYNFKVSRKKFKNIIRLGLFQLIYMNSIPDYAAVNETVNLCKKRYIGRLSKKVNALLRIYLREKDSFKLPQESIEKIAYGYSFPHYLIEEWVDNFGKKNTIKLCEYFNKEPDLNLHFYGTEDEFKNFLANLKDNNIDFSKSKYFPNLIKIHDSFDFRSDPFFIKGKYYIQDESTLLPVQLLDISGDEKILDLCAAPGGKTFDIANRTDKLLYANDIDQERLQLLKNNAIRLHVNNLKILCEDGTNFSTDEKFDKILIDATCSGYGVIQKKPEIRLKKEDNYKNLIKIQKKLLNNSANLLKSNGVLVYSTCTINKTENEERIEEFLNEHNDFELENPKNYVDTDFVNGDYVKISPHIHNMDGSFAARLRKKC